MLTTFSVFKTDLQDVYFNEEDPKGQGCRTYWVWADCCSGHTCLILFFRTLFYCVVSLLSSVQVFIDIYLLYRYRHCLTWKTLTKSSRVTWRTCTSTLQSKHTFFSSVNWYYFLLYCVNIGFVLLFSAKLMSLETERLLWLMFLTD